MQYECFLFCVLVLRVLFFNILLQYKYVCFVYSYYEYFFLVYFYNMNIFFVFVYLQIFPCALLFIWQEEKGIGKSCEAPPPQAGTSGETNWRAVEKGGPGSNREAQRGSAEKPPVSHIPEASKEACEP